MATRYRLARLPFADGGETLAGLCPCGCTGGGRIGSLQLAIWEHLAQQQGVEAIERLVKYHKHGRMDRYQSAHRQRERHLRAKLLR